MYLTNGKLLSAAIKLKFTIQYFQFVGTSACNGDSGSGMVFQKTRPQSRTQVWQLRGIVSLSVALQNQARCNTSHYVVFTDVAKHAPWIQSVINPSRRPY